MGASNFFFCQCHDAALATAHVTHMNIKITSMQNTNCQRPHVPKLKNTVSRTQDRDIYRVSIQVKLSLIWEVTLLSYDIILLRIIWSMFDLIFVSLGYDNIWEIPVPVCLNFCCHPHLSQVFQQDDITPITTACLHRRRVQKSQVVGLSKMVSTFCCESNVDIWKSQHIDLIYILHDMAAFLELEKQTQSDVYMPSQN